MDSIIKISVPSEAHPETMDFLSKAWCNFAVQALQSDIHDKSVILIDDSLNKIDCPDPKIPPMKIENGSAKINDAEFKSLPPWKSNDVKSWIWMQQAMHPELNYNSCFRKKWMPWKMVPFKTISIKKWLKERTQRRKEEERLQRAEVHAAVSVAGVAAALAAIAAENSKNEGSDPTKENAVASAAALVAAQCAQVAESMGAKKEQLTSAISSAMTGTSATDILTLTAAASTSLKGAATLKARTGCKNRLNGSAPVLPIEESNAIDVDFNKCRSILANGTQLHVETPDGNFTVRSVSVILNGQSKVVLKVRKLNLLKTKIESIVMDMHAELYKDVETDHDQDVNTCYLIVLTTNQGVIKLDMGDDYDRYKTWATTINHMLLLSTSFSNYQLQFYHK